MPGVFRQGVQYTMRYIELFMYVLMYIRLESEFRVLEIAKAVYTHSKCAVIHANHWF